MMYTIILSIDNIGPTKHKLFYWGCPDGIEYVTYLKICLFCVCNVVTGSGLRSSEHDRTAAARPGERSRERDVGDRQRPASSRNDHGSTTSQQRESRHDAAGERSRDSCAVPDRQPVKTASSLTTTDSRAKSSSASTAGGQLTTSSQPRSSTGTSSTAVHSEKPSTDKSTDKTPAKVSNCCIYTVSVGTACALEEIVMLIMTLLLHYNHFMALWICLGLPV